LAAPVANAAALEAADAAEPVAEVEAEVAVGVAVVAVLATEATLAMEEEAAARRLSDMIS
jgi:hypothetical protein